MEFIPIAKGVESEEQWETLKVLGCDLVQGYLFGTAMPVGDIETVYQQLENRV